jgi:hypothetical protein
MSLPAMALVMAIAAGCGSSSSSGTTIGTIDNGDDLAALMDAVAVPMAGLFTNLSSGAVVRDDGASVRTDGIASLTTSAACPQGGSASYTTGSPGVAAFTACGLGGVVITGSLSVLVYGQPPSYGVNLGAGTLTLGGAASGTINIVSGMIQWSNPATDANTYWEINASVGSTIYCAWSGGTGCR